MLLALLQGCSTQFTYNRLDWLISWYMGDYIDLDREQKVMFRQRLEPLLEWHRYEELGEYIQILDGIEQDLGSPVTEAIVGNWMENIIAAARRIESRMLSLMLDIGADMDEKQIADFEKKLWKSQAKYREDYLDRDDKEYQQENFKSLAKNLRRFMGKLDTLQQQDLQQALEGMHRFDVTWLEDRERWLTTLTPLLAREPGWQDAILFAHSKREDTRSSQYREIYAHNTLVLRKAIAGILNNRSDIQNRRMLKEIKKLREDLAELASKKTPVSWYEEPTVEYRL